jgi:hypothetical protein
MRQYLYYTRFLPWALFRAHGPAQPVAGIARRPFCQGSYGSKKERDMKKKGGKSLIAKDIMAEGFTARKATKALNVVIEHMKLGSPAG